ncbi:hypothetical protein SADUNF_Sadunf03G0001000 [Salix dunnii]|uniref:Uncharacterized protein n=1 Tax=Salix dunnii TaxID=1413687 RepID=A0A835KCA2_9ROSI|nr:hypothetical protein SADUNF_Sadunf03G0001000 [Salix dunnii]
MGEDHSSGEESEFEIDDVVKEHGSSRASHDVDVVAWYIRSASNLLFLPYSAGIVENEFLKQDWRSPKKDEIYLYVVLKCKLALLIGLGTGLVGFFHNLAVEIIPGFKLLLTNNLMLENKYAKSSFQALHLSLIGTLLGPLSSLDGGLCALLGSASFLGGTMRMIVSLCVILIELGNDLFMLPLIMLMLLISKTLANTFNKGIYDHMVKMKEFSYMEAHEEPCMRHLVASDVVSVPLISFSEMKRCSGIMWTCLEVSFAFVAERKEIYKAESKDRIKNMKSFKAHDFAKAGSDRGEVEDSEITEEEMEM